MTKRTPKIFPREKRQLEALGERLRLARLRRQMSAQTVAARANISRTTLHRAESGSPKVSMGAYYRILAALRLERDLDTIARDDELGRRLQDLELPGRKAP